MRRLLPDGFAGGHIIWLHQHKIREEGDGGQPRRKKRRFKKKVKFHMEKSSKNRTVNSVN